jgi:hypothetical protein
MNPVADAFEEFILALDAAIRGGARAEQALRTYVLAEAERIRHQRAWQNSKTSP